MDPFQSLIEALDPLHLKIYIIGNRTNKFLFAPQLIILYWESQIMQCSLQKRNKDWEEPNVTLDR